MYVAGGGGRAAGGGGGWGRVHLGGQPRPRPRHLHQGQTATHYLLLLLGCAKCDLAQAERVTALDMLERETRRGRVLENRAKALRVADK